MDDTIYFHRGPESHYSYFLDPPSNIHRGIFFAEDTHRLYLDGELYAGDNKKRIINIKEDVLGLVIEYDDETTTIVSLDNIISKNKNFTWYEFN